MPVHFSSRVDVGAYNPIARAERQRRAKGIPLRGLNDSNPTRHGLAPAALPTPYAADPRGPLAAREALASFLTDRAQRDGAQEPRRVGMSADGDAGGAEAHACLAEDASNAAAAVDPRGLYLLSSTSQAYSWLCKLLCDPGDVVLAPKPAIR